MSRQLIVLLALVVAAGGALVARPRERDEPAPVRADRVPSLVADWIAAEGASEELLPTDPRAIRTLRRTYSRDGHAVLLSVASYPSWNHPDHRPLAHMIAPTQGAAEMASETLRLNLAAEAGGRDGSVSVNLLSLQWRTRQLAVAYWYQLDDEPIANEYGLRLRLFVATLRGRPRALTLIRLAGRQRPDVTQFLEVFYPRFRDLLVS
jgi:EpsI family protein